MNISFFEEKPLLDDLDLKIEILDKLKHINIHDLLNTIFYGLPYTGKTTKIYAFLATILDKRVYDLKNITFEEDRKKLFYKASIYHIEIDPIILGSNEKFFIQTFLKSYCETKNIGLNIPKIVLVKNAHLLSKQSQLAFKILIENNLLTSKFIFEISNFSKFNTTLGSRCVLIKIPCPKFEDVKKCLINHAISRNYQIDDSVIEDIIKTSNKTNYYINLKKVFGYYLYYISVNKKFEFLYYDKFDEIITLINSKKISFINLQKIRDIVNELYINLVPMNELLLYIFNTLYKIYINDNSFLCKLIELTQKCDINLIKGNKECLHLEHYIISIIDTIHNK